MEVTAKLNHIRKSPKKVRLVANQIKGKTVLQALDILSFSKKEASRFLLKLVNSAIANAEHNFNLDKNNLLIKEIFVNEGITLKRWQPRAMGRATPLRKRASKISLILSEIKESKKVEKRKQEIEAPVKLSEALKEQEPSKVEPEKQALTKNGEFEKKDKAFDETRKGKHRHMQHDDKREMKKGTGFLKKIFKRRTD